MTARALLALDAGRTAEAETTLREILSAGLLLADEATFEVVVASPVRAAVPDRTSLRNPFGFAARLLPGGPRCGVVWGAM